MSVQCYIVCWFLESVTVFVDFLYSVLLRADFICYIKFLPSGKT